MDNTWTLLILSLAMLLGCYISGVIPLAFHFTETKVKIVPVLGTGLLIGTALAVIIPEGVHVMYSHHHNHAHSHSIEKMDVKEAVAKVGIAHSSIHDEHSHNTHTDSGGTENHENVHSLIGVALVAGFITMLLIDQLFGGSHAHSAADPEHNQTTVQNRNKFTATLGLVIHAAADGIALGAAVTMSEDHVTLIVFLAIMLHKAPASFGLVSFLMLEGLERARIKRHLLAFSVSAPLLSILTYLGLSQQNKETLSNLHATGLALLFSAGTFLYVATVHVLPEVANTPAQTTHDGMTITREQKGFNKKELFTFVLGSAIPVILALSHKH
ncbi:zinc transporter ZIP9-B [Octopus bimaculoides]|uniref:Zinc transporter ZIP9 n=1 Tax=Octopus bimaculoides TaxID=37653 RepID=A0A0L8GG40_OCTBM|nr:zinc transporter ZIP9-B [Octopus bimaculoides]|eukprot:XP_014781455.1 PREDICTED: zinc transporter ZIP9-B-like [Octopus bimaculoides]